MKDLEHFKKVEQELFELRKQVELEKALERLRESAVAMSMSSDLKDILSLTLRELRGLGIVTDLCAIQENEVIASTSNLWYATASSGEHALGHEVGNAAIGNTVRKTLARLKEKVTTVSLGPEESSNFAEHIATKRVDKNYSPEQIIYDSTHFREFIGVYYSSKNTTFYIGNFSGYHYSELDNQFITRFALLSEQIFTRYTSLSKIEKKARETKIEAMLERIRVRSIEMTNTSKLQDIVNLVSKQLQDIHVAVNGGVFICINEDVDNSLNVPLWGSGGATAYVQKAEVPFLDRPIFQNLSMSIRKRVGFITEAYTQEEKVEFFEHLFENEPWAQAPSDFKNRLLALPGGYTRSAAILAHTTIFIINNEGGVFSEEDNDILKRFSVVFEQSYVRFLDLRKSEEQARELAELNQAKSRLYTNITHEFRTPLTVILGLASQIQEDPRRWLEEGLPLIQRNSNRLLKLVNQMLELSKLESKTVSVVNRNTNINVLIKSMLDSMRNLAQQKEVTVQFSTSTEVIRLDVDANKLQNIVINLLSNAIKYSKQGDIVDIETKVNENDNSWLSVVVRDTGAGIAEQDLPYIFDRFYQANNSYTRVDESSGIGLAIVKELVLLMDGEIKVASTLGVGSEFTVLLPIKHIAPKVEATAMTTPLESYYSVAIDSEGDQEEVEDSELAHVGKPIVLVIEDNADVTTYITACIGDMYSTRTAINGRAGIDMAIELIPDIVILDVMMPIVDGYQACQYLKTDDRTSHIPIVMLSAKADMESKREGLVYGADAYLYKPFDKQELLIRLEQLIALRKKLQLHYTNPQAGVELLLPSQDQFLSRLTGVIDENLADSSFGVQELCAAMGLSRTQLLRKLKALMNSSTSTYIKTVRLNKAKQLLQQGEYAVSEVAYMVGFNDPLYFSRAFSARFGLPPSSYYK